MPKTYKVHIEESGKASPRPHELQAATILSAYFKSDLVFLRRAESKTPDLFVLKTNIRWEIKSPEGAGKRTIQTNLRDASKQSENIILDLHRTSLSTTQAISRVKEYISNEHSKIKRLKILTKTNQIIDILEKKR